MANRALEHISQGIAGARTSFSPFPYNRITATPTNISGYITPVQFARIRHDIKMWRDAILEMEDAWYPMRVKANRMYMDTVENPYIAALIERYKELTLQRDFIIYKNQGGKIVKSEDLTQALNEQKWFEDYIENVLEARLFGYTLISLGEIVDDKFPNIQPVRRENIRPDGLGDSGAILTSLVYSLDGIHVEQDPLIDMCNHWIPTKSNRGVSTCGYGLLYKIALLEIHLRHILEWNMDYTEMYGMPIKKGTTGKIGEERKRFEAFLRSAASNAYVLLDKGTNDDITYEMAQNAGTAWKNYENIETRLQGIASQLVLGHTDAMKSTPGKLGGMQNANKDGNNINLIQQAINSKQVSCGDFVCRKINEVSAPRFRRLGKYVGSKTIANLFPVGYQFGLLNDVEENEIKRREGADRTVISTYVKDLNDAGWDVDEAQLSERLGLKLTKSIPEHKLIEERKTDTTINKTD